MSHFLARFTFLVAAVLFLVVFWLVRYSRESISVSVDLGNALVGIGAGAAALVALLQVKANSFVRTAEFRQAWIERLRSAVAEFLAVATHYYNSIDPDERFEYQKKIDQNVEYIELLLNHSEFESKNLIRLLKEVGNGAIGHPASARAEFFKNRAAAAASARLILKSEWEVIKREIGSR
jgi:hypothetical protein